MEGYDEVTDNDMIHDTNTGSCLADFDLDWEVRQHPLKSVIDGQLVDVPGCKLNVRSDTETQLGVVANSYRVIQNSDMEDLANAITEEDPNAKIDDGGCFRDGKIVYMLVKTTPFALRQDDEVVPYLLLANGHDARMSLRVAPTSIRPVCENTLYWALGKASTNIIIPHTANAWDRVQQAKSSIVLLHRAMESQREAAETLAKKTVSREEVQQFWMDCYTSDFGKVRLNPVTKVEERRKERAMEAMGSMSTRFDRERDIAGATAWNAVNAYTGWLQNDRETKTDREERRLFGVDTKRTSEAFGRAIEVFA